MVSKRQPDKKRTLNALRHMESEEIPFQDNEFDFSVAEKILGKPLPRIRSYELPVTDMIELNLRAGNDLVYFANVWELGRKNVLDAEGRKHYRDGTMKTRRDLAKIAYPDIGKVRHRIEEVLDGVEGTGLGMKYCGNEPLSLVMNAIGYEDYYLCLKTDPAFIHEFLKRVNGYCVQELKLALKYPFDVMRVFVSFCSCGGAMISREMIEEFEYPGLRERLKMIQDRGIPVEMHIDGDFRAFIPDFIEMGIDVIHPIEPCGGRQDIYEMKKQFGGKIALHGNIDLAGVLVFGTPDEVARDVEEHLRRLAVGGGYICGSSHDISKAVPIENFYAMRDTVLNYKFRPSGATA